MPVMSLFESVHNVRQVTVLKTRDYTTLSDIELIRVVSFVEYIVEKHLYSLSHKDLRHNRATHP